MHLPLVSSPLANAFTIMILSFILERIDSGLSKDARSAQDTRTSKMHLTIAYANDLWNPVGTKLEIQICWRVRFLTVCLQGVLVR
jgi:hypothetical protein